MEEITFENYLDQLEKIVARLEDQDTPLDEAMALFSKGVEIVAHCNEKLEKAQQSVKILLENNGTMLKKDFTSKDE